MQDINPAGEEYESPTLVEVGSLHTVTQANLMASGHDHVVYLGQPHRGWGS